VSAADMAEYSREPSMVKLSTACARSRSQFLCMSSAGTVLSMILTVTAAVISVPAQAQTTCNNPQALGVSRTVELDTLGGQLYGNSQYIGNPDLLQDKEVVLTFDDGPLPETTRPILDTLDQECTKATFFVVGRMALAYQTLLRDVDQRGHTIGAHTWSHQFVRKMSPISGQEEIELGVSMIAAVLGKPPAPFFRFPYLDDPILQIDYLKSRDMGVFSIDVDSYDSHGLFYTKEKIIARTIDGLKAKGKGIVLMHDIKRQTMLALPEILKQLRENGFKIVHLVSKQPVTTMPIQDAKAKVLIDRLDAVLLAEKGPTKPVLAAGRVTDAAAAIPQPTLMADASRVAMLSPGTQDFAGGSVARNAATMINEPLAGAASTASNDDQKPADDPAAMAFANATDRTALTTAPATPSATTPAPAQRVARAEQIDTANRAEQRRSAKETAQRRLEQVQRAQDDARQQARRQAQQAAKADAAERSLKDQRAAQAAEAAQARRAADAARASKRKVEARIANIQPAAKPKVRIITGSGPQTVRRPPAPPVIFISTTLAEVRAKMRR
jgi:peptidoglycan-N-acetylglucosamine deacetylase